MYLGTSWQTISLTNGFDRNVFTQHTNMQLNGMLQKELLSFPEYSYWYEAIISDDVETLKNQLSINDENKIKTLLNGTFAFDDHLLEVHRKRVQEIIINNVWHLVVILCSKEAMELFLSKGVDIHATTELGNNIIHSMIIAAGCHPEHEDVLMGKYNFLMQKITKEDKLKLLRCQK